MPSDRLVETDPTDPQRPAATIDAPVSRGELSDESRIWLERLVGEEHVRRVALAELHALLVKAARFTLAARMAQVQERRERLDDLAVEAADDALVAILAHLDDFRGESRFTTWAWKFAVLQASVAIRRRGWTNRELPTDDEGWAALAERTAAERTTAESGLEHREVLAALKDAIEGVLTPYQRRIFVALALNEVPVDVLAERLGTTRGALYKTLHDARHKLRARLASAGLV